MVRNRKSVEKHLPNKTAWVRSDFSSFNRKMHFYAQNNSAGQFFSVVLDQLVMNEYSLLNLDNAVYLRPFI